MRIQVVFAKPQNGWMQVEIITENNRLVFIASYVPYDSLSELAKALCNLLRFGGTETVRWNTEPTEYFFNFSLTSDGAKLKIFESNEKSRNIGNNQQKEPDKTLLFTIETTLQMLILPFWRALRKLETIPNFEQDWGRSFPKSELKLLTALVKIR